MNHDPTTEDVRALLIDELAAAARELRLADVASRKAMARRAALAPGSSRARVTSANADWARAAEHRDHMVARMEAAVASALEAGILSAKWVTP